MNDNELDELLNSWKTPQPRDSWRQATRAEIVAASPRPARKLFTSWRLAAVAAAVIFAVVVATPNIPRKSAVPFFVESKITYYVPGGLPWDTYPYPPETPSIVSFNDAGTEVILSWTSPDHPYQAALWKARLLLTGTWDNVVQGFISLASHVDPRVRAYEDDNGAYGIVYPDTVANPVAVGRRTELLSSGCRSALRGWRVIGEEVLLNYPTVMLQEETGNKLGVLTVWLAPELSCFPLRAMYQGKQSDGTWKTLSERNSVKVTINR